MSRRFWCSAVAPLFSAVHSLSMLSIVENCPDGLESFRFSSSPSRFRRHGAPALRRDEGRPLPFARQARRHTVHGRCCVRSQGFKCSTWKTGICTHSRVSSPPLRYFAFARAFTALCAHFWRGAYGTYCEDRRISSRFRHSSSPRGR